MVHKTMHNLLGDARGFIGDDKKGFAAGTGVHTLYASSCQGYGHGDMSLANRTLDLDVPPTEPSGILHTCRK